MERMEKYYSWKKMHFNSCIKIYSAFSWSLDVFARMKNEKWTWIVVKFFLLLSRVTKTVNFKNLDTLILDFPILMILELSPKYVFGRGAAKVLQWFFLEMLKLLQVKISHLTGFFRVTRFCKAIVETHGH